MPSGKEAVSRIAAVTCVPAPNVARYARALREHAPRLWATAPRGGGRASEQVTPLYLSSLVLALALPVSGAAIAPIAEAPDGVDRVRALVAVGKGNYAADLEVAYPDFLPSLTTGTFGGALETIIEALARDPSRAVGDISVQIQMDVLHQVRGTIMVALPDGNSSPLAQHYEFIFMDQSLFLGDIDPRASLYENPGCFIRSTLVPFAAWNCCADMWRESRERGPRK